MSRAERANFLMQCWRRGEFRDAAKCLSYPLRSSLYRLRRGASARSDTAARPVSQVNPMPSLSPCVSGVFSEPRMAPVSERALALLRAEVDAYLRGTIRLGGAARFRRDQMDDIPDPEHYHAFNRLYWAARLARAAAFGHQKALAVLCSDLTTFLDQEHTHGSFWSPYTVSERIASLAEVLFWTFAGGLDLDCVLRVKQQMWRDAVYLSRNIEYDLGVHNHLLNNARGLYCASRILSECRSAAAWVTLSFSLWDEFFPKLLLADGAFAEQSSHYHVLLTRTALEYMIASEDAPNHAIGGAARATIKRMFLMANDLVRTDGTLPRFGDNSPDGTINDLSGFLAAAYFRGYLEEPPRCPEVTPLTLYYCEPFGELPPPVVGARRLYSQGGYAFLRGAGPTEVAVHGDPGAESRAHGDAGRGSFEIWRRGRVIVREPGSFLNQRDPKSLWYRSSHAQNVTRIDGLGPGIDWHAREPLPSWYFCKGGEWSFTRAGALRFDCYAYKRHRSDVTLSREWSVGEAPSSVRFEESIRGAGSVSLQSRLFLGDLDWNELLWDGRSRTAVLKRAFEDGSRAEIVLVLPDGITPALLERKYMPEYGIERPCRVIALEGTCSLPCSWVLRCTFSN